MSLDICVITPEKIFLTCKTDQIILPTTTGSIGVLSNHAPLVTVLEPGVLRCQTNWNWILTVVHSGFAEVTNNQVIVVVKGAEEVSVSKDLQEAERDFIEVKEKLEKLKEIVSDTNELEPIVFEMQITKARLNALRYLK
jgi:F-type H+-transporting ATPase subunit epsilon